MPPYSKSVFINCPFDDRFEPLFHAIVLTIVARGFIPRCALESEGEAETRIDRILWGISTSRYSIHDLSRFQGEGLDRLSRFNMPLELGIAVGVRHQRKGRLSPHNWVALVPAGFVHHRYISDLAGFDVPEHDQTPAAVIAKVSAWLSQQPDFEPPSMAAKSILASFEPFRKSISETKQDELGILTWPAILRAAVSVLS